MSNKQLHIVDKSYVEASRVKGFSSENRFRKEKDKEYEELEKEIEKLQSGQEAGDPKDDNAVDPPVNNDEDANWKKRYGDLRSHASKKEQELRGLISSLEQEVNKLKTKDNEPKYPKTQEEVEEWMQMYPDVAAMIQTIAGQTSEKVKTEIAQDIAVLNAEREKARFLKAYNDLLGYHPDFDTLRTTDDFNEWMSEQPEAFQKAIYEPRLDDAGVKAAARVIDLYKKDKGLDGEKASKTPKSSNKDAARMNARSSRDGADGIDDGAPKFTESQVQAMSIKEYERLEPEILAAQRKGPPYFIYDLSGAAR